MSVTPAMSDGGNISVATAATGANYTAFPASGASQGIKRLVIVNTTGTDIEFVQDGDTAHPITLTNGTIFEIYGITSERRISVRRVDQSNTPVTVKARWET